MNDTLLRQKLKEVNLAVKGHEFVVSATFNQLLQTELVSCYFAPGKIRIILHIPIKRIGKKLKLFRVIHSPYSFREKECTLENSPTFVVQMGTNMIPITSDLDTICPLALRKMCIIPEGTISPSKFSLCAAALAESKPKEIMEKCVMICEKATTVRVNPISSHQFQVTNANNFTIKCNGTKDSRFLLQDSVGAVLLKLKCECTVISDYKIFIRF